MLMLVENKNFTKIIFTEFCMIFYPFLCKFIQQSVAACHPGTTSFVFTCFGFCASETYSNVGKCIVN